MSLLIICKITVLCLMIAAPYSATSDSILDCPDTKMRHGIALQLLPPPVANPIEASSSSQIEGTIIPLENRTNTFENFYTRTPYAVKVKQLAKSFAENLLSKQSQLMYWSGASGKGKTHLAVSVAKTLTYAGKKVLFLGGSKMHDYLQGIPRTTSSLSSEQYFGKYDMVIVDALNSIDSEQRIYLRALLIDISFDRGGLKVLITSNMDVNTFIENLSFEPSSKSKINSRYFSTRIDVLLDCAPNSGVIDFSRLPSMRG